LVFVIDFNRIKVKETPELHDNTLLDEIKFLDSALCEIEKVPNLILDLVRANYYKNCRMILIISKELKSIANHTNNLYFY